ncbi:MAG: hypothetical protein KDK07_08040 [Bauldia sp.]|nr:hypothetical protein [Bauldia sp.]
MRRLVSRLSAIGADLRAWSFAVVGIIVGYLLGGWVYEYAGDGVWLAVDRWQTLLAGIVALGGAVITVSAIRRQMDMAARHRSDDRRIGDAAVADHLIAILICITNEFDDAVKEGNVVGDYVEDIRQLVPAAMKIDGRIGTTLQALVLEYVGARKACSTPSWPQTNAARGTGFRADVLATAVGSFRRALSERRAPPQPLVSDEALQSLLDDHRAKISDLGWAAWVTRHGGNYHGSRIESG